MEPGYADGWVNVGRARIQEGNMEGAEQVLRKALEVDPQLAKTHFFLATALKALGRYDEAIAHLQQAAATYPRDRVVLNQLGRVFFLKRQYRGGHRRITESADDRSGRPPGPLQPDAVLSGTGRLVERRESACAIRRFKADESSQAITGDLSRLNPDDNNERQSIHEHRSQVPLIVP